MTIPAPLEWSSPEGEMMRGAVLTEPGIAVTVEDVALRLGIDNPTQITTGQRVRIVNAIVDAQAVVEGELGRSLIPKTITLYNARPHLYAGGGVLEVGSWPALAQFYDPVVILSAAGHPDGSFDLTVKVGLDGASEEPIRAFIRGHAVEALRLDPASDLGQLAVTSVSAEGQSISYEKRSTTEGTAGALPTLRSLRRYKRTAVYQAPTRIGQQWPYRSGLR